ncbi:MAG: hypothetical protein ACREC6_10745, partial [Hyphomicrobiaceae bacterium]
MTAQPFGLHTQPYIGIELGHLQLNCYGDHGRVLPSNLGYGTDISFDRLDELDLQAIAHVCSLVAVRPAHRRP